MTTITWNPKFVKGKDGYWRVPKQKKKKHKKKTRKRKKFRLFTTNLGCPWCKSKMRLVEDNVVYCAKCGREQVM